MIDYWKYNKKKQRDRKKRKSS